MAAVLAAGLSERFLGRDHTSSLAARVHDESAPDRCRFDSGKVADDCISTASITWIMFKGRRRPTALSAVVPKLIRKRLAHPRSGKLKSFGRHSSRRPAGTARAESVTAPHFLLLGRRGNAFIERRLSGGKSSRSRRKSGWRPPILKRPAAGQHQPARCSNRDPRLFVRRFFS